jgi:hypothetical protein
LASQYESKEGLDQLVKDASEAMVKAAHLYNALPWHLKTPNDLKPTLGILKLSVVDLMDESYMIEVRHKRFNKED